MLPLLLALYSGFLGDGAALLQAAHRQRDRQQPVLHRARARGAQQFFVGTDLTGADIQMLFVLEAAGARLEPYPAAVAYRDRMHARPAYQRAHRDVAARISS